MKSVDLYDVAEHLRTPEERKAYINAYVETEDYEGLARANQAVARSEQIQKQREIAELFEKEQVIEWDLHLR